MKKFISLLLCGVLSAGILAGCGKTDNQPTTAPTTETVTEETKGTASYESAEALLKAVHAAMKEEFPAAGGDEAHGAEDVGSFDISAYGDIQAVRAGNVDENTDRNLIVLGTSQDNALLRTLNDRLSFRYTEDGTGFASNESQILSQDYARRIGIMQLLPSPYGVDRSILAVCAAGDEAMSRIGEYLQKDENTWKLKEDAVIFDPNGEIHTYRILQETAVQTPDLKEFVKNNKDTVLFAVAAVSAMALFLLAVILVLVRMYLTRRKDQG